MPGTVVSCRRCPRKTRRSKPCKTPQTSPAKTRKKACMVSLVAGDRLVKPISAQRTPPGNSFWLRLGRGGQVSVQTAHTPPERFPSLALLASAWAQWWRLTWSVPVGPEFQWPLIGHESCAPGHRRPDAVGGVTSFNGLSSAMSRAHKRAIKEGTRRTEDRFNGLSSAMSRAHPTLPMLLRQKDLYSPFPSIPPFSPPSPSSPTAPTHP